MSTTEVRGEIPLEEIQRTLSEALGRGYRVTATSDSTLKIQRMPLMTATVNVKWAGQDDSPGRPRRSLDCRASTPSPSTPSSATPLP